MTEPAPDPKARRLIWRAVQSFSAQCQAPNLSPGCPYFARDTYTGQPFCAEECNDLLGEYGDDDTTDPRNLMIGPEIGAHPHRQRSDALAVPIRPFDARELTLRDRSLNLHRWGPAALFGYLIESVQVAFRDPDKAQIRPYENSAIMEALAAKGFDKQLLAEDTALHLAFMVTVVVNVDGENLRPELEQWRNLLNRSKRTPQLDLGGDTEIEVDLSAVPNVAGWFASLPINEMFQLRCPTSDEFRAVTPVEPDVERAGTARWLFDRFSETYLEQWSPSSLRREWDWLQRGTSNAQPYATAMSTRVVDRFQLASLIADLHCVQAESTASSARMPSASAFVQVAAQHLEAGRRDLAASLFDACRSTSPKDPHAHNNYGFCILPDDPASALTSLQRAADLGMSNEPVNIANRVFALTRLGRYATAVQILNEISAETWAQMPRGTSFVWDPRTDSEPSVLYADPCDYLCDLAQTLATITADSELERQWNTRRVARHS